MDFELMVTTIVAGMVSNGNFTLEEDMRIVVDAAIETAKLIKEKTAKN